MPDEKPLAVLKRPSMFEFPDFRELWDFRELTVFLAWRELRAKYKHSALGVAWAVIPPMFNTLLYSFLFGMLAKFPSDNVPYALLAFIGVSTWGMFARGVEGAGRSLMTGAGLSSKVYFPRLTIVVAAIISSLVDSVIAFSVLLILMPCFGIMPSMWIVAFPLFLAYGVVSAVAVGLWISALTVRYRDVTHGIGMVMTIWMYMSPVAYSPEVFKKIFEWKAAWFIYWMNPMAVGIQGVKWSLIGSALPPIGPAIASVVCVALLLVFGLLYFCRVEKTFIDMV